MKSDDALKTSIHSEHRAFGRFHRFRRPVLFLGLPVLLFCGFWFQKETLLLIYLKKKIETAWPGSSFRLRQLRVTPSSLIVRDLDLLLKKKKKILLQLKGVQLEFNFTSLPFLMRRQLTAGISRAVGLIERMDGQNLNLTGVSWDFKRVEGPEPFLCGMIGIGETGYEKIRFFNAMGFLTLREKDMALRDLLLDFFGGQAMLNGRAYLTGREGWGASGQISLRKVHVSELLDILGVKERVDLRGVYSGEIMVHLENNRIIELTGKLSSSGGGDLIVKEKSFVENGFGRKQGLNILVDNLREFHYDIGSIELRNNEQNIELDVHLEGAGGTRNLVVAWHGEESDEE